MCTCEEYMHTEGDRSCASTMTPLSPFGLVVVLCVGAAPRQHLIRSSSLMIT